jgi:transcriptional regulator MraZ
MLRGNHPATVDAKGRLKIPAAFLADLRELGEKFYVTSEKGDCAKIFPMRVWDEVEAKLAKISNHNRAKQKFLDRTNYFGQVVELDSQGRLLMPPVLREAAQMVGEVNVLGNLEYLTIWNQTRFLDQLNNNPITDEDEKELDGLGI